MRGVKVSETPPRADGITARVLAGDWPGARLALAMRLAQAADATDSARDLRSIARTLVPLLDICEADQDRRNELADTPLHRILELAGAQEPSNEPEEVTF